MDPDFPAILFFLPIAWLAFWIGVSILYRRSKGKPVFPRVPRNALFAEAWRSGSSQKNFLTQLGGAKNCLLVYVADGTLTITPVFPFNLMFLAEIYGLDVNAPVSQVQVTPLDGLASKRLRLTIEEKRFELRLNDVRGFEEALAGKARPLSQRPADPNRVRWRLPWRARAFQVFAIIWGLGASMAGFGGLADDLRFRTQGIAAAGNIAGEVEGGKGNMGVVQYEVAGRSYTLTSLRGSGTYKIGDTDAVHYLPGNPSGAREDDYLPFDLLFASLGSIMLMAGLSLGWIVGRFRQAMNLGPASQILRPS
jgi:hypothetical protein